MDKRLRFMADLIDPLLITPGSTVRLSRDHDPGYTGPVTRPEADALLAEGVDLLATYQDRLAAQDTFGVLLVLQGLDASGKDSTIKHVMSGLNPQGVTVRAFKQPSAEELSHDFLWRYQYARGREETRRLGPALPRDQRLGTLPGRQRHPCRQDHAQRVEAGAGQAVPQAHRPAGEKLEVLRQ
jgi:hypothetical protein